MACMQLMGLFLALALLLSCAGPGGAFGRRTEGCPKLDSALAELYQASDPERYAREHGLEWIEGRVRVVIELRAEGSALPQGYDVAVEARNQRLVQGLVRRDQLCPLSNEPEVVQVRRPLQAVPLR